MDRLRHLERYGGGSALERSDPLAAPPRQLTRAPGHYANPSWSPKGDRLALIRGSGLEFRGQQPEDENFFEIHWLDANGGDTNLVTTVTTANAMRFHPQAFWAPDGTRLIYRKPVEQTKPDRSLQNDVVSVRLDGTDRKAHLRLPAVDDLVPSPDGQWVGVHLARQRLRRGAADDPDQRAAPMSAPRKARCRSGGCLTTRGHRSRGPPTAQ